MVIVETEADYEKMASYNKSVGECLRCPEGKFPIWLDGWVIQGREPCPVCRDESPMVVVNSELLAD